MANIDTLLFAIDSISLFFKLMSNMILSADKYLGPFIFLRSDGNVEKNEVI